MEGQLVRDGLRLTLRDLLRRCREVIADAVEQVAGLLRHTPGAEVVQRRLLETDELLAFDTAGLDVGKQRLDVLVADRRRRRAESERLTGPRDPRELEQERDLALVQIGRAHV